LLTKNTAAAQATMPAIAGAARAANFQSPGSFAALIAQTYAIRQS
jgi:hypothetical protein